MNKELRFMQDNSKCLGISGMPGVLECVGFLELHCSYFIANKMSVYEKSQ